MVFSVNHITGPPAQSGEDQCTRLSSCKKKDAQNFQPKELSDLPKHDMKV